MVLSEDATLHSSSEVFLTICVIDRKFSYDFFTHLTFDKMG